MRSNSSPYTVIKDTARPFRIWDTTANKHVPGRCYKHERKAHDGALLLAGWSRVKQSLDLYDVRTARHIGCYTRELKNGIQGVSVWRAPLREE